MYLFTRYVLCYITSKYVVLIINLPNFDSFYQIDKIVFCHCNISLPPSLGLHVEISFNENYILVVNEIF